MAGDGPRILSAGEASGCETWKAPAVDAGSRASGRAPLPLTAADLESLQREAWDEAFASGRAEGVERGYGEGRQRALAELTPLRERCSALLDALAAPLAELDEALERELVTLAAAVARQIVRREIRTDPALIATAVREAAAALPSNARRVTVRINPGDLEVLREALAVESGSGWTIVEDATVERGGCRVESEYSRIDAEVETRLATVVAQVLGGDDETGHEP